MAIGASRGSVVRLFVFESLLVSVFAGIAGAFLAWYIGSLRAEMAANFLPFDREYAGPAFAPRARLRHCHVDSDRRRDGNLSGVAKRAR